VHGAGPVDPAERRSGSDARGRGPGVPGPDGQVSGLTPRGTGQVVLPTRTSTSRPFGSSARWVRAGWPGQISGRRCRDRPANRWWPRTTGCRGWRCSPPGPARPQRRPAGVLRTRSLQVPPGRA
jgi:hypothetical protein